jgi:hypothetical protein
VLREEWGTACAVCAFSMRSCFSLSAAVVVMGSFLSRICSSGEESQPCPTNNHSPEPPAAQTSVATPPPKPPAPKPSLCVNADTGIRSPMRILRRDSGVMQTVWSTDRMMDELFAPEHLLRNERTVMYSLRQNLPERRSSLLSPTRASQYQVAATTKFLSPSQRRQIATRTNKVQSSAPVDTCKNFQPQRWSLRVFPSPTTSHTCTRV